MLREFNLTLAGRVTVGPAIILGSFRWHEWRMVIRDEGDRRSQQAGHMIGVAAVLWWVLVICDIPFLLFFFGFVYCGTALSRLRSYAEYRFAGSHEERTAIVERSPPFGLLFLYNNLHALHHRVPALPWYMLPRPASTSGTAIFSAASMAASSIAAISMSPAAISSGSTTSRPIRSLPDRCAVNQACKPRQVCCATGRGGDANPAVVLPQ